MYKLFYMQVIQAACEMGLKLLQRQLRSCNWIQDLGKETSRLTTSLLRINNSYKQPLRITWVGRICPSTRRTRLQILPIHTRSAADTTAGKHVLLRVVLSPVLRVIIKYNSAVFLGIFNGKKVSFRFVSFLFQFGICFIMQLAQPHFAAAERSASQPRTLLRGPRPLLTHSLGHSL
jgi:hypothetical protein